VDSEAEVRSA